MDTKLHLKVLAGYRKNFVEQLKLHHTRFVAVDAVVRTTRQVGGSWRSGLSGLTLVGVPPIEQASNRAASRTLCQSSILPSFQRWTNQMVSGVWTSRNPLAPPAHISCTSLDHSLPGPDLAALPSLGAEQGPLLQPNAKSFAPTTTLRPFAARRQKINRARADPLGLAAHTPKGRK